VLAFVCILVSDPARGVGEQELLDFFNALDTLETIPLLSDRFVG
jgi:hypothetical protein